mmetsp:Transcript_874/g.2196  ORF Transcript_874/g.2196 Transcript_874/m.2196 type:complete len:812 (-) Transcript_874:1300-3735(-)|eukprot:CAMPEP_0172368198 /NCGR_PEP_ID=MMETSP1060-20121228/25705_1 /TAXON_ID=37318 /ORGANISM="Pseudo-nitzschia pungens, Strain cf. cingulata" /LENGTH=811 /DNA_ID=CAMNT_0013092703 /DNA_START=99 /DNA_END=2534 /DNA_ORIENTATION=-
MLPPKVGVVGPLAIILLCYLSFCECFTSKFQTPSSFVRQSLHSRRSVEFAGCDAKKKSSEFSVVDDEEEEDDDPEVDFRQRRRGGGDLLVINEDAKSRRRSEVDDSTGEASSGSGRSSSPEYAALRPGTVVQVQVGDLSLARKAWKKRRRTGSPLLVPCSILNVDRRSAVRWNLIFLLEKFGQPGKGKRGGIVMSLKDIARYYRSFLKSSLGRQSEALGFDSNQAMVEELFNKKSQESYGVFFEKKEEEKKYLDEDGNLGTSTISMLYLTAPINRRKAQQRASNPAMLQFRPPREGDYDDIGVADTSIGAGLDEGVHVDGIGTLTHTGWIRAVKEEKYISEDGERKLQREYSNFPLSACLRVSQKDDLDTGRVQEGKILPAVVFDFDKIGDGGSPLLTLSLNAASGGKQRLKIKPDKRYNILKKGAKYQLSDLKVGDGPYRAKVIKLIGRKQKALVDLGVGRELSSAGGNVVQVLGILRYQDAVELEDSEGNSSPFIDFDDEEMEDIIASSIDELDMLDDEDDDDNLAEELLSLRKGSFEPGTFEDGEVEEDISGLYELDENGQLVFKNPETGGRQLVEDIEEDDEDNSDGENVTDDDDISDEDMASLFSQNEDGSITYKDPETGETLTVNERDDEFKDMIMVKSLIDDDLSGEGKSAPNPKVQESKEKPKLRSKRLQVGEYIEVYISNVSKQSNKFQVTTNPLVKGQKAKDIKKEAGAKKKLDRLKKSFGGDLDRIYALKGRECKGIVKATSKTGDWVYVQPTLEDLPVGIASLESDDLSSLSAGDNVLVRISGIDEGRGQLSMNVISKV